jgi:hypothetical protein
MEPREEARGQREAREKKEWQVLEFIYEKTGADPQKDCTYDDIADGTGIVMPELSHVTEALRAKNYIDGETQGEMNTDFSVS